MESAPHLSHVLVLHPEGTSPELLQRAHELGRHVRRPNLARGLGPPICVSDETDATHRDHQDVD
eukprot:8980690-Pyramimonas_sp.AAC.1